MNMSLSQKKLQLTFFGQAGFVIESPESVRVGVDLYLSDCCERYFGFKRLMPYIADAASLNLDVLTCTHAHYDHFDPDSVPIVLSNPKTRLVAAYDVRTEAERLGLKEEKITYIQEGDIITAGDIQIKAIPCDHGTETPHAIGLQICIQGKRIVIAGDTCFHEEYFTDEKVKGADVLILPINGAYGNLNEREAAEAVKLAKPKLAIPCHYWNFMEHGGNPATFVEELKKITSETSYLLMRPGETVEL